MALFAAYLRAHWKAVAAGAVCAAVFAAVFALYRLPVEAVGYAALICSFLGVLALSVDFYFFCRRHRSLQRLLRSVTLAAGQLPPPRDQLEADYQQLFRALSDELVRQSTGADRRYADLEEYFTLWAHQVKTPLSAMRLLLQQDEPEQGELRAQLQRVEQYVQMVLCYLRLDSDSTDYLLREYDLDGIVRRAVRGYAGQFIRKKLRLDYAEVSCRVLTDEKWLLFVIEQVLSNALKYTPAGGTISIRLEEPMCLVIADTGIGIAPEDLPRVFERGFTGYNGRRDQKASGIGLYLCRRILNKLGHGISIDSAPGVGTTVRLELQRRKLETE